VRDRTLEHLRSSLRAVAYAGHEGALAEFKSELERMPTAVAEIVRKSAVDIAAISRENPGRARRVVDELAGKIAAEHGLGQDRASIADRDAADTVANRIRSGGSAGYNSAEDVRRQRQATAAREALDATGEPVPWKQ